MKVIREQRVWLQQGEGNTIATPTSSLLVKAFALLTFATTVPVNDGKGAGRHQKISNPALDSWQRADTKEACHEFGNNGLQKRRRRNGQIVEILHGTNVSRTRKQAAKVL